MSEVKIFVPKLHPDIAELNDRGEFRLNGYELAIQGSQPEFMATQEWANRIKLALERGRFEITGGFQSLDPRIAEFLPADEVVLRTQGSDQVVTASYALFCIKEVINRQQHERYYAEEVAHILAKQSSGDEEYLRSALHQAFYSNQIRFYQDGFPITASQHGLPLGYGLYTTPEAINEWLCNIKAQFSFPQRPTEKQTREIKSSEGNQELRVYARELALQHVASEKSHDRFPSQEAIGDWVASRLREAEKYGPSGKPLTGAYLKRHFLQGISSQIYKQLSTEIRRGK